MRVCPFRGCDQQVPLDKFACLRHWHSLTSHEQQRLRWGFQQYRAKNMSLEELRTLQQGILGDRGNVLPRRVGDGKS